MRCLLQGHKLFKRLMVGALILVSMPLLTACDNDDEPLQDYFVNYTVTFDPEKQVDINYTGADGKNQIVQTKNENGKFQTTVGPVKKGFEAELVVSYSNGGPAASLQIDVKHGEEPFVTKAQSSRQDSFYSLRWIVGK